MVVQIKMFVKKIEAPKAISLRLNNNYFGLEELFSLPFSIIRTSENGNSDLKVL